MKDFYSASLKVWEGFGRISTVRRLGSLNMRGAIRIISSETPLRKRHDERRQSKLSNLTWTRFHDNGERNVLPVGQIEKVSQIEKLDTLKVLGLQADLFELLADV